MAAGDKYPSTEAFFAADERRRRSGESDFGCWWLGGNLNRTTYRVSAVKDTGEIYLVRLAQGLRDEPAGEVEVLVDGLRQGSYDDAELVLAGWAEACGEKDSLKWVRERCAAFSHRPRVLFPLGSVVATARAAELLDEVAMRTLLDRHVSGDWGDLEREDKELNDSALEGGGRVLSRYDRPEGVFYVITEHDRSATTVLLHKEY